MLSNNQPILITILSRRLSPKVCNGSKYLVLLWPWACGHMQLSSWYRSPLVYSIIIKQQELAQVSRATTCSNFVVYYFWTIMLKEKKKKEFINCVLKVFPYNRYGLVWAKEKDQEKKRKSSEHEYKSAECMWRIHNFYLFNKENKTFINTE